MFILYVRLDAGMTDSEKSQFAVMDATAIDRRDQLLRERNVHIDHRVAVGADEVRVRDGIRVIALHAVHRAEGDELSLLPEHGEVAVDRAKRKVRIARLELAVYPLGSRMRFRRADTLINRLALFASLV